MKFEFYTHSLKPENEDIFGVTEHGAFIMDGASALLDGHYTPRGNDVVWMVHWWKDYLKEHFDELDRTLHDIMERGVEAFNEEFSKFRPVGSLSKLEQVSAGFAAIRRKDKFLECFVLGDVEISIKGKKETVEILTDSKNKHLDEKVIKLMNANKDRENSCVFKDFTEEEWLLLKKHRAMMNTDEGYYILSHDVSAISKGIYKVFKMEDLESCLLSTDGISPLDHFYSRNVLMDEIRARGIKTLVDELRNFEREDSAKVVLKRLKTHDDATAVYVEFIKDR